MDDEVLIMKEQKCALELKMEELELKVKKLKEMQDVIKIQMFFLNKELASTLNKSCSHENVVVLPLGYFGNEGYCKDCGYELHSEYHKKLKPSLKALDERDKALKALIFDKIKKGEYEDKIFNELLIKQINDDCKHDGGKLISVDKHMLYCNKCGYNIVDIHGYETVVYPTKASKGEKLVLLKK